MQYLAVPTSGWLVTVVPGFFDSADLATTRIHFLVFVCLLRHNASLNLNHEFQMGVDEAKCQYQSQNVEIYPIEDQRRHVPQERKGNGPYIVLERSENSNHVTNNGQQLQCNHTTQCDSLSRKREILSIVVGVIIVFLHYPVDPDADTHEND